MPADCLLLFLIWHTGLYIANVYSDKPQTIINAPAGDFCASLGNTMGFFNRRQIPNMKARDGSKRILLPDGEEYYCSHADYQESRTDASRNGTARVKAQLKNSPPSGFALGFYELFEKTIFCTTTGQTAFNVWFIEKDPVPARAPAAKVAQADAQANGYGQVDKLYGGLALMIVGQTTVSSRQGNLKVEETGSIEYPIYFLELADGLTVQHNFPIVSPGDMKLLFTHEEKQEQYFKRR